MFFKEELIDYMTKGYIHVSRQDFLFFNNLSKFIGERSITSGQNKLLDKLVDKYQKQLRNNNLDFEFLKSLPYKNPIIETDPDYLKTYIKIVNDDIVIKSPFNKKFMNDLARSDSSLEWDKKRKVYTAPFSTYEFRSAINLLNKNFDDIVYCPAVTEILNDLKQYEECYWNPTLVKSNGNFYIAAANQYLLDSLDFELNDNPKTLFELNKHAVQVDKVMLNSEESKFASTYTYHIDIKEIDLLIDLLKSLDIDNVTIEGHALYRDSIYKELRTKLSEYDIRIRNDDDRSAPLNVLLTFKASNVFWKNKKASKIVLIKNGRPINIT